MLGPFSLRTVERIWGRMGLRLGTQARVIAVKMELVGLTCNLLLERIRQGISSYRPSWATEEIHSQLGQFRP